MKKTLEIVICKDKNSNREEISELLKALFSVWNIEIHVQSFTQTGSCLEYLEEREADIVILGLKISGEDGLQMAEEILALNFRRRPEIVFESSHTERVFDVFQVHPFAFVRSDYLESDMKEWVGRYIQKTGG